MPSPTTRRHFLARTAATAVGAGLALDRRLAAAAHVSSDETLKIGLVGCGGRGRGAAIQALRADANTRLIALGDIFQDQIDSTLQLFNRYGGDLSSRIDLPAERCFVGFDAYQKVIDSGVDVVLLATPPHFRPQHLEACVKAGKHVFAEKPVAVDAPGVKRVLAASEAAKKKDLAVVSGLCWRYHYVARASIRRIHDGAVGRIVAMYSAYNASRPGKPWPMRHEKGWSPLEWQLRNWYWFTWLSGDHIVEQAIHSMDKAAWAVHDAPPVAAVSLGGLQARRGPELGTIYDHHAVVYEYADGLRHVHTCRQQPGCANDVSCRIVGTRGVCEIERGIIRDHDGKVIWKYSGPKGAPMHQQEHNELFASLRAGTPINNGHYMAMSTMLAILGRMASYTGKKISWDQAMASKQDFTLPRYDWDVSVDVPPIAIPGVTPFV
ncbi:MAG: gfo/Idh/MocA family oxidoreductase [Planctomycetota bacterium]|nr:MAG: gfo/Idh/MocA family oxidoreductase [Planctomycetota bacterium]